MDSQLRCSRRSSSASGTVCFCVHSLKIGRPYSAKEASENILAPRAASGTTNPPAFNITNIGTQLYFNITTPSITALRSLRTPWPVVVSLLFITFSLALYEMSKLPGEDTLNQPREKPSSKERIVEIGTYLFNSLRAVLSVILLARGIATGHYWGRGIGHLLNQANLLLSALHIDPHAPLPISYYFGITVAFFGVFLYFVSWLLAQINNQVSSVTGVVVLGGDSNPSPNLLPLHKIHPQTLGDTLLAISWYLAMPFLLILPAFMLASIDACLSTLCRRVPGITMGSNWPLRAFAKFTFFTVCVGGSLAVAAAVLNARTYTLNFVDCQNATRLTGLLYLRTPYGCLNANVTFPGDGRGFWETWRLHKTAVLESLITW
ncbi:hypothetical protein GP486_002881 [Trichoglossum hirsutum]|uniref:Uncharacterized protein n=1 Tax=Trichoglossum hirsutum TaxID=265104 RepID=A0A9P8LE53_9PEZI|nr:hypothetical protein GP486_002881 [Trichoglossum hirsutum]